MKLKIKLLSDLCTGSGDIFNSAVDTDVVYDSCGLPYIPAKRLKGCIREAFLELEEFGVFPQGSCTRIFGKEGSSPSCFTLSSAYLEDYPYICSALDAEKDETLKHPQNVLGLYTYTRTQTAMDPESGTAEENTLRTMRVVKSGLVFEADLDYHGGTEGRDFNNFRKAAECVKHIGAGRSRGLGLVNVTMDTEAALPETCRAFVPSEADIRSSAKDSRVSLSYTVTLDAPMICKSPEGSQEKSQAYIEGSKMLGLIAGALGQDGFHELVGLDENFIVTNAYITAGDERCTPIRASLRRRKDASFDENGDLAVFDMLEQKTQKEAVQTSAAPAQFVSRGMTARNVSMDISYHHRRPDDKSVGRATGKDNSAFYQMESIRRGQSFKGFILASEEQAVRIARALKNQRNIRMGYGRNAEYGAVTIRLNCEAFADRLKEGKIHEFTLKLNSPAILYNRYGMLSADVQVLKEYLENMLGVSDLVIERAFLKYQTVGGFQVTWGKRKPVFTALGQGSVCLFSSQSGVDVSGLSGAFVGERTMEGFGEIEADTDMPSDRVLHQYNRAENIPQTECGEMDEKEAEKKAAVQEEIIRKFILVQVKNTLTEEARRQADETYKKCRDSRETDAALSRMMMICRTENSYEAVKEQAEGIEKDSKQDLADQILKGMNPENRAYSLGKWEGRIQISSSELFRDISDAYLKQLKYRLRPGKQERRQ